MSENKLFVVRHRSKTTNYTLNNPTGGRPLRAVHGVIRDLTREQAVKLCDGGVYEMASSIALLRFEGALEKALGALKEADRLGCLAIEAMEEAVADGDVDDVEKLISGTPFELSMVDPSCFPDPNRPAKVTEPLPDEGPEDEDEITKYPEGGLTIDVDDLPEVELPKPITQAEVDAHQARVNEAEFEAMEKGKIPGGHKTIEVEADPDRIAKTDDGFMGRINKLPWRSRIKIAAAMGREEKGSGAVDRAVKFIAEQPVSAVEAAMESLKA